MLTSIQKQNDTVSLNGADIKRIEDMYAIHSNVLFIILQTTRRGFLLYNLWQTFLCIPSSLLFCWTTKGTRFLERQRECTQPVWCGKPVCDVMWLNSHKLRAATSPGFLSVSLVSHWKFCTSRKEGIWLWSRICRSACAWTAALPDAASAQVQPVDVVWECSAFSAVHEQERTECRTVPLRSLNIW